MKPLPPAVSKSLRLTAAAAFVIALAACEPNTTQNSPPPNEPAPKDKVSDAPAPDNNRRANDLPGGSDGSTPTNRDPDRDGTSDGGDSSGTDRPGGGGG
ncbi:MAG: hypothetical protein GIKADHBN_01252 [Phycisphaerales bacterium]|nr:hypothetical protein [Phycisphaerales bacterium]